MTHAGIGVVVTLLIVLAGAAASLFPEGIRNLPLVGPLPGGGSLWGAVLFVLLVGFALVLVFWNQRGLVRKAAREQAALSGSLRQLDNAVRRLNTLPSESFLPSFQDSYRQAFGLTMACVLETGATVSQVEAVIRLVLCAIAETAKDFDQAPAEAVYGANLMLFRERSAASQVPDALSLVDVGPSHHEYLGALELDPALSTSTEHPGEIDARTHPISLPVPTDGTDYFDVGSGVTKSVVLPGAPTSYVKGSFDGFARIDDFLVQLRGTAVERRWVGRMERYFTSGDGRHVRSFASLPVPDIEDAERQPLGTGGSPVRSDSGDEPAADGAAVLPKSPLAVLNIHSDRPGLLEDNGSTLFAPLMGPFLSLIAILIVHRKDLSSGSTGPVGNGGVSSAAERSEQ